MNLDRLRMLMRLRKSEVDTARTALAARLEEAGAARSRAQEAEAAIAREFEAASRLDADDAAVDALAAWLPRGRAAAAVARGQADRAEAEVVQARAMLTLARSAAEAVQALIEAETAIATRQAAAREQAVLDEAARHREPFAPGGVSGPSCKPGSSQAPGGPTPQ